MHYTPTASIKSPGASMQDGALFKQERPTPWNLQRSVPAHILAAREVKERKDRANAMRDEHSKLTESKPKGVIAKTVGDKFRAIGFGEEVSTYDELFAIADRERRAFVMVDGVKLTRP